MLDTSLVIDAETEPTTPEVNTGNTEVVPETPAESTKGFGALPIFIVVAVIAAVVLIVLVKRNKTAE